MTDPDELRRLAAAATRARKAGRTVQDMSGAIRFQDVCITAIPELLDALEAARKDAAELRASGKVLVEANTRHFDTANRNYEECLRLQSENADLRRQLAGLGIPTGETK